MNHPKKHSGSPACGSTPQICNNLRNLRFPKSAAFVLFAALCVLCGSRAASAAETPPAPPTPYRYQLVTDGQTIWPLDTVATKASVNAATNQVASVEASVADLAGLTETLGSRVNALEAALDDLGEDGVWALEGYVNSIGLLTGTPEYDGTIEIVHLTVTPSATDASKSTLTLWAAFDPAPVAASQVAMVGTATLDDAFADVSYACSYPTAVGNPNDSADTRAVYTFAADFPKQSGFAKIVSTEGSAVGVGDYLPITGGLSVNGVNGVDATITADDGTTLVFKGGILVEATPVTTLNAEDNE